MVAVTSAGSLLLFRSKLGKFCVLMAVAIFVSWYHGIPFLVQIHSEFARFRREFSDLGPSFEVTSSATNLCLLPPSQVERHKIRRNGLAQRGGRITWSTVWVRARPCALWEGRVYYKCLIYLYFFLREGEKVRRVSCGGCLP